MALIRCCGFARAGLAFVFVYCLVLWLVVYWLFCFVGCDFVGLCVSAVLV